MLSPGPALVRQQAEVLAELGAHLHDRRLELGMTLEEVESMTCVPVRLLKAIEAADLETLPEAVYTQGLLRRFADALNIDGLQFGQKYPTGIDPTPRASGWKKNPAAQLRPFHLYFAYVAVVIAAVTGISLSLDRSPRPAIDAIEREEVQPAPTAAPPLPTEASPVAAQPQTTTPAPAASPAPTPTPAASPSPTPEPVATPVSTSSDSTEAEEQNGQDAESGPLNIELTVTSESWLQVLADGEVAFEGTLSQGQKAWSADREITVVAGNAGAIMVTVNGNDTQEPLGQPGAVEEVTFMADSRIDPNAASASTP